MVNTILWTIKAARQLRKLPRQPQKDIRDAVEEQLTRFPDCHGIKALTNHEYEYRLRVGRYRVLFDFDGTVRVVSVQEVRKRDERTY